MSTEPIAHDHDGHAARRPPVQRRDAPPSQPKLRALVHRVELAGCYQRAARARQLRSPQLEVLALEYVATARDLTLGQLADRLGLTSGGVTALTQRLEGAGLVARRPHKRDRRMRVLVATPEGLERARAFLEPMAEPAEQVVSWLSDSDRMVVGRFLEMLASLKEQSAGDTPAPERDEPCDGATPTLLM